MRQLTAIIKKECLEQLRTGRLLVLLILFFLSGIMNPGIAKLTPWMFELMTEQLAENGMTVGSVEVSALTSWTQFFKNMPILLIVFLIMFSGTLTEEYQKGTLVNLVTKGLKRWKVIVSKLAVMAALWTGGCLLAFAVTYGYNAYFWDNGTVENLLFSAFGFYMAGVWLISVVLLASVVFSAAPAVFLSVGAAFALSYLLGFLPDVSGYVPTHLLSSAELMTGAMKSGECIPALSVTCFLTAGNVILSVIFFDRKIL